MNQDISMSTGRRAIVASLPTRHKAHEALIDGAAAAWLLAADAGSREDAAHHWAQIKRLIALRSPVVIDIMEQAMGFVPSRQEPSFYDTEAWRDLRYQALKKHGGKCQCCGASRADGAVLHVDHVRPRSIYPDLALSLDNLQVLCKDCNLGKSNRDATDWRA